MKIAVIGAGFCGLATVWHLLNHPLITNRYEVTLFDRANIGAGASGIAAGLLHSYVGASAKLNWRGKEGLNAAHELIQVASEAIKKPVYAVDQGILRLALTDKQIHEFKNSPALEDPQVEWLESDQCQTLVPCSVKAAGLWIKNGMSIYSPLYLQGLWQACTEKGAVFQKQNIETVEELKDFTVCIFTVGAALKTISELTQFPLKAVKGQVIELEWPTSLPILPCALVSNGYIVMKPDGKSCVVGSTYEKVFHDDQADLATAKNEILPKAIALLPELEGARIIDCYAGLRAVIPGHLPLLKQINAKQWVLTGMGSKGLLYHALMAQELVQAIALQLK